jgi:hypothetical protein
MRRRSTPNSPPSRPAACATAPASARPCSPPTAPSSGPPYPSGTAPVGGQARPYGQREPFPGDAGRPSLPHRQRPGAPLGRSAPRPGPPRNWGESQAELACEANRLMHELGCPLYGQPELKGAAVRLEALGSPSN